jgi:cytoskeleton protein RodZ
MLSVTLKVPVRQLEALESDDLDPSKGPVFYRGLTSSVCRQLRMDPTPVLALLPSVSGHLEPLRSSLHAQGIPDKPSRLGRADRGRMVSFKVLIGAALMLVLTGALVWLPAPSQWVWLDDVKSLLGDEKISEAAVENPAVFPPADTTSGSQVSDAQQEQAAPVVVPSAQDASAPGSVPVSNPPALTPAPPPAAPAAALTQPATAAPRTGQPPEWVFSATGDSWLEVRNAQKVVVWSGLLKAGQSNRIQTPLPVSVVIGHAQMVSVTLGGQPFDLKPHTQVTVARFEVKE